MKVSKETLEKTEIWVRIFTGIVMLMLFCYLVLNDPTNSLIEKLFTFITGGLLSFGGALRWAIR